VWVRMQKQEMAALLQVKRIDQIGKSFSLIGCY
jgi:hypothetical protein